MKNKRRLIIGIITGIVFLTAILTYLLVIYTLNLFNYVPYKNDCDEYINIPQYISEVDKDGDGLDDQTDILENAKKYVSTNPKYKSQYYSTGYPNDGYGVCTDVVAFGLKGAGYDLMLLVNEDVKKNPNDYNIETIDINIDFRRVRNLKVYFDNNAISLTTDITKTDEWQGGDIIVFENHIGIISDRRNRKGIPLVIHHVSPHQTNYEEDFLESSDNIVGHYRIS